MKACGCKIYYSIAFICYLEVVLWTTLVLSGCIAVSAGPEGSAYLQRETVNQGRAGFNIHPAEIGAGVTQLVLKAFDLHQQLESLSIQKLVTASLLPENLDKEGLCGNSTLQPVSRQKNHLITWLYQGTGLTKRALCMQALKGVPAPFTGISVIL
eukprot:scaffold58683_cov46-Prasinocladus_malaysianus.AAC.1